jgi:glyoxylase-like metal-dependent hydrolase (beta-lactamase superfamily II)
LVRRTGKSFRQSLLCGQAEHSAWAVTTSQGIIIVDALFDYSVEDEIVGGLKKLGLDPASIKYVIVSHGHIDHAGRKNPRLLVPLRRKKDCHKPETNRLDHSGFTARESVPSEVLVRSLHPSHATSFDIPSFSLTFSTH